MARIQVVVVKRTVEAEDIVTFELADALARPLPPFEAGAHIDVEVGGGVIRQYSLCNAPGETHRYLIGVLKDPASRGGSRAMHESLAVASVLHISAPRNLFALAPAAHTILVGGGIGITPLLAMAECLAGSSASFELHYCARSPERMAFRGRIAGSAFADKVHCHFDSGADDQRLQLERVLAGSPADTRLYVCGPGGFMDHVIGVAERTGWPPSHLHLERFAAAPGEHQDQAFDVELARSGGTFTVSAGLSVVQVLGEHGIFIPVSCEQGICGTCLTGVVEGVPAHRDSYLTEQEQATNKVFTPCCSRSRSARLVLDL